MTQIFNALSDPTRLAVIQQLSHGPRSVGDLAKPFDMALPSFMQHLKVLESAGLVLSGKKGRIRTCYLHVDTLKKAECWLEKQRKVWSSRLDRLDSYVLTMEQEND